MESQALATYYLLKTTKEDSLIEVIIGLGRAFEAFLTQNKVNENIEYKL